MDSRKIFESIGYVLRTGIQGRRGSPENTAVTAAVIAIPRNTLQKDFSKKWKKGLSQHNDLEWIAWKWKSIDAKIIKAITAEESVGANPTDRG